MISSTTKGLEVNRRKCIVAEEESGQTSKEGVYAGGDAVTGAATVILAMGAGKAGAKGIDEYLKKQRKIETKAKLAGKTCKRELRMDFFFRIFGPDDMRSVLCV